MTKIDFKVLRYLNSLKKFLYGDLNEFRILANSKEKEEQEFFQSNQKLKFPETSSKEIFIPPTTTSQTTAVPSFQASNHNQPNEVTPTQTAAFENILSEKTFFRSTIPHSLVVLATVDLLGALLRSGDVFKDTTYNMREFLVPYNFNEDQLKLLIKFYRHGMAHSFFPKHRFGISYHSSNETKGLYFEDDGLISLNLNYLIKITKERFEYILQNETLHAGMEKQFNILINSDKDYLEKNIDISNLF